MGYIYKWLGSDEQAKELWQNREALEKYLARLKELMEDDIESEKEEPKPHNHTDTLITR